MAVKLNKHDLQFILDQIKIAEAHVAGTPLDQLIAQPHLPYGLRTVDGSYNNLIEGRELWGADDQIMPRMMMPFYLNEGDDSFHGMINNNDYGVVGESTGEGRDAPNGGHSGNVVDADPRIISNLISDQTLNNPAAITAALQFAEYDALPLAEAVAAVRTRFAVYLSETAVILEPLAQELQQAIDAVTAAQADLDTATEGGVEADIQAAQATLDAAKATLTVTQTQVAAGREALRPDLDAAKAALDADLLATYGIEMDGNSISIPNVAPDEGLSAPFNGWMTFFGQFFDHGLDLIHKGDNGTIYMPLMPDDPLVTHGPDGIPDSGDEVNPNMPLVLTRLTPTTGPGPDGVFGDDPATTDVDESADDTVDARNKTTPFVDQNQTYTSHPSHQVFLRHYDMVENPQTGELVPLASGRLLNGAEGGLATWADVKLQAKEKLGIELDDRDVFGVPLILTDPYGEFIRDENGFPQVVINIGPDLIPNTADDVTVSGTATDPIALAELNGGLGPVRTSHAFLDDIAHNAVPILVPGAEGQPAILLPDPNSGTDPVGDPVEPDPTTGNPTYDNELLDAHFIVGDGRGNENIGLTAVHHVFHAEHNRQVEANKKFIIETGDAAFIAEWFLTGDLTEAEATAAVQEWLDEGAAAAPPFTWDGERLFQTARFATEMQYQHLVFEEFGRKVQPNIDPFIFNTVTDVNPAIFAEFAHTVYRFGHSMLTDHLKLLPLNEAGEPVTYDENGNEIVLNDLSNWGVDVSLIDAFLNPVMYNRDGSISAEQAAGAIFRGMTYVRGSEIDEFVVDNLRNNLLGLPLDLPAINIARGRDAGVPSLNEAREQLYAASNSSWLKPYESWADFGANLKTPASIVNFIAAYGTHPLLLAADTLEAARDVAMQLVGLADPTENVAATVVNSSFETNTLESGQPGVTTDALGNYTTTAPDGWTLAGQGGLIDPAGSVVDQVGIDGTNVAWLRAGGMLSQDTGQTLEEGVSYRLTLDIGDRSNMEWPGGQARLVASNGTVLATLEFEAPVDGNWSTVTLETGPINVALAGEGLSIEIQQGDSTSANQILIDNVRLDVVQSREIADRLDFLNGTGEWTAENSGLNAVDLWIGGLAEKIMPFGGMLGSTFNAVFELQLENLQEGDRFYYLSRTQGLNLLNELENNAFSKMIAANTDMTHPGADGELGTEDDVVNFHVGVDSFAKHDLVLEVDEANQIAMDPEGDDPFLNAVRAKVQRDDPSTVDDPSTAGIDEGADANYLRFTGGEHAVMGGTENDDTIIGGDGDDAIWGEGGNDRIEGGHGVDLIVAGYGDDLITDTGDTGDFIKGEGGNDVIANSNGLDVVMSGDGKDAVFAGVDATEVFAGEGDDFILGGLDHDFILGNEGDDWMEGGDGFDVLNGDNSELFFNSTILGHDVAFAGANENDFDMESGDDIMVQGESVMRNEGMFGFDWAIHKGSPVAADSDMRIPIFTTVFDDILRDRFDQTEALSGWIHNDVLRGDDRGSTEEIEVEFSLENHGLTQAGVNRIDGLRELLGDLIAAAPTDPEVDLEEIVAWAEGNILLGGDGNDTFEGRGADDFIHGDAWLNVRIRITGEDRVANDPANEVATVDTLTHVFTAQDVNVVDNPETAAWIGKSLSKLLLEGVVKPGQMHIVREIKYDENTTDNTDTAIFAGNQSWYEITHLEGDMVRVTRREDENIEPQVDEGTDILVGIERIQFSDGMYTIRETGNFDPTGRLVLEGLPATEGQPLTVKADEIRDLNNPDGKVDAGSITYLWQIERNDGTGDYIAIPGASGDTFVPSDEHSGLRIRVIGTYVDSAGVTEIVSSAPSDIVVGVNDEPEGPLLISDMSPTEGQVLTATVAFNDPDGLSDAFEEALLTYQWQYSATGDVPMPPEDPDAGWTNVSAQAGGNARSFVPGPELVGQHLRIVVTYEDDLLNTHRVESGVTQVVGNHIVSNAGTIDDSQGDGQGGTTIGADHVEGGISANDISGGDGGDALNGGAGNDTLDGAAGDDTLNGGAGADTVSGGAGNDTIVQGADDGADSIDGGDGEDTLRIIQSEAGANDDTVEVSINAGAVAGVNETASLSSVEYVELDTAGGNDTLVYNTTDDVSADLLTGAATGFSFIRGLENVTGGGGNDTLQGNSLGNALAGAAGDDTVSGGFGNDTLAGDVGNDDLRGDEGDDVLEGGAGNDRIDGGEGMDTASYAGAEGPVNVTLSDFVNAAGEPRQSFEEQDTGGGGLDRLVDIENLTGSGYDDVLTGNEGANVIDGGAGADMMVGGAGDDTYVIDSLEDVMVEADGGGDDTVRTSISMDMDTPLADGIENIVLTGTDDIDGRGQGLDNRLTGNSGDNVLNGAGGTNTVVLEGAVSDYDFIHPSQGPDVFDVTSEAGGTDRLINIQRAEIGGTGYGIVRGNNVANTVTGTAAADLLLGHLGNDELVGNSGDDILVGGGGNDAMLGEAGNDTYVVNDGGDTVDESGGAGIDTIISTVSRDLSSHPTRAGHVTGGTVENLVLVGDDNIDGTGNEVDNVITGNSGNNRLGGGSGGDTLTGNAGDDRITGHGGDDTLKGGSGNDVLNGSAGVDTAVFDGPAGNYSFGFDGNGLASVTDNVGDGGTDSLAGIERLQFGNGDVLNIVIGDGNIASADPGVIFGGDGNDTITGSDGDDVTIGGAGDDVLFGTDVGDGGDNATDLPLDDDTFIWNAGDGSDTINAGFEGAEGDRLVINGNAEAEIYRIYTVDEAIARIAYEDGDVGGDFEAEIVVTRQVGDGAETVIAAMTEIEEISINGSSIAGNGIGEPVDAGNDVFEVYGDFDTTTSLRPNTITIVGSEGDDTLDISSLMSAHRIVFRTKGGNDTIIGTLRPQDVVELEDGKTIDDYTMTTNADGSKTISTDTHSVTFFSNGEPQYGSGGNDDDGHDQNDNGDDDQNYDDHGDDGPNDDQSADDDCGCEDEEGEEGTNAAVTTGSIAGTPADDVLTGTVAGDLIFGMAGTDFVVAGNGADVIRTDEGDDFVYGEDGRDIIFGGEGDDDLFGGADDDAIYGEEGEDYLNGGGGNDGIDAGDDDDTVFGGSGNDIFDGSIGDGNDTYDGGDGADTLDFGSLTQSVDVDLGTGVGGRGHVTGSQSGVDTLYGVENITTGAGNDRIEASTAVNVIDGGDGEDVFVFSSAAAADGDTILSFETGDKIDLSGIDADTGNAGVDQFTLEPGSGRQIVVTHESREDGDVTVVSGNTGGNEDPEFRIEIAGSHNLTSNDFNF